MSTSKPIDNPIHAVIAVWHRGSRTFYVKRSAKMQNYPLVWSLMSIQFDPLKVDPLDLEAVQPLFERMSRERLCSAPIRVKRYLSAANCADNPMARRVFLYMYEVELEDEPKLNPDYYVDAEWLEPVEYERRSAGSTCGLCMRMWSDYCVRNRLAERPFAPPVPVDNGDEVAA
jgi:hypothetical protein